MVDHEKFMKEAIKEAKKCLLNEDVPIGAVITCGGKIISRAYNKKEWKNCATYHAEIIAIEKACLKVKGAILSARIKSIYFGAYDKKYGTGDLAQNNNFNHKSEIVGGICQKECEELLSNFFKKVRNEKCKLK